MAKPVLYLEAAYDGELIAWTYTGDFTPETKAVYSAKRRVTLKEIENAWKARGYIVDSRRAKEVTDGMVAEACDAMGQPYNESDLAAAVWFINGGRTSAEWDELLDRSAYARSVVEAFKKSSRSRVGMKVRITA